MNAYEILGIVVLSIIVVLGGLYYLLPYLAKKGIPVANILTKLHSGIDAADNAVTTVNKVAPIPYFSVIDKIFDVAREATEKVEDLYKIGQLNADDRKENAKLYIENGLKEANINVTDDIKKVVDGAIDYAVTYLPKTHQE